LSGLQPLLNSLLGLLYQLLIPGQEESCQQEQDGDGDEESADQGSTPPGNLNK
jgi:hypothetical protein